MTSFIIAGKNSEENKKKALELCQANTIDPFDITIITSEKESVGIEVVKKLQEKIFFKPLRGTDKAIIIPDAQQLTIPAQNALLKLLEEPPAHTLIFLLTDNSESLLGTIKSRCQIIKITDLAAKPNEEDHQLLTKQLQEWTTQDVGSALKTAELLAKDRDQALLLLQQSLIVGTALLQETVSTEKDTAVLARQLRLIQVTHRTISSTNTGLRLALEHLFLSQINL